MGEAKRRRLAGYEPPLQQAPYEPVDLAVLGNQPTVGVARRQKSRQMTALRMAALLALVGARW